MPTTTTPGVTVLLTQLSRVVYRRTSEDLLGMRLKEFVMLAHLREHAPVPQQELGEMLCIDANNLVLLLNELESRALPTVAAILQTAAGISSRSPMRGWPPSRMPNAASRAWKATCSPRSPAGSGRSSRAS